MGRTFDTAALSRIYQVGEERLIRVLAGEDIVALLSSKQALPR